VSYQRLGQHPSQPAELDETDAQEKKRKAQPQTAALPGRSTATELLSKRFVRTTHDASFQPPEFQAPKDRKRQTDDCGWQPVNEGDHVSRPPSRSRTAPKPHWCGADLRLTGGKFGDLRSGAGRGLETRAQQPANRGLLGHWNPLYRSGRFRYAGWSWDRLPILVMQMASKIPAQDRCDQADKAGADLQEILGRADRSDQRSSRQAAEKKTGVHFLCQRGSSHCRAA